MLKQPRVAGGRSARVSAGLAAAIERALEREVARWDVSKAFVTATALAFALGVSEQPDYKRLRPVRRRRAS